VLAARRLVSGMVAMPATARAFAPAEAGVAPTG